jgi:hypothetical protein
MTMSPLYQRANRAEAIREGFARLAADIEALRDLIGPTTPALKPSWPGWPSC